MVGKVIEVVSSTNALVSIGMRSIAIIADIPIVFLEPSEE
jgi:hypothetical protein